MIEKIFLGWDKPFLWLVEEHLRKVSNLDEALTAGQAKTNRILTPSKRSNRRLIELICAKAEEENLPTLNIEVSTLSELPHILFQKNSPPIERLESLLIWKEALNQTKTSKLSLLSIQDPIFYLESLRDLLATVGYRPNDIIDLIESEHSELDLSLWQNINIVWETYESILLENNIFDSAGILYSLSNGSLPINLNENLILAGCHNIAPVLLKSISSIQTDLKILINAPQDHAVGFSDLGILIPDYWNQCFPTISHEKIKLFDSDSDQTKWISEELTRLSTLNFPQSMISIVPLDPNLTGPLELAIESSGYNAVLPGTKNLKNSSIGNLILAITDYFAGSETALNRIIEHPIFLSFAKIKLNLELESTILKLLDNIQQLSTERSVKNYSVLPKKSADIILQLKDLLISIDLKPIKKNQTLNFFTDKIIEVLKLLTTPDYSTLYSYEEIEKLSTFLIAISENVNLSKKEISAKDFNNFLKEILYKEELSSEHAEGLEVIGWLEAQLDDSQACFIMSCNDKFLPQKTPLDPLLPNSFRNRIGLPSKKFNDSLTSFAINTLVNSKKIIRFTVPKISFSGDLTKISKFIALGSTIPLSDLVHEFYEANESPKEQQEVAKVASNLIRHTSFEEFPLANLSPTKIKSYLHCPYSFYLQYVLKADIIDYEPLELTPLVFGSVLHSLFEAVGTSESHSKSEDEFESGSEKIFAKIFDRYLGVNPSITLQIQKKLLWSKFESFKKWHLDSIKNGWEILACEHNIFDDTSFNLRNGKTIPFKGKLDRLEYHPDLKEVRCIDFKTGNTAYGFKQALSKKGWQDPQIPLYVELLQNETSPFNQVLEASKIELMYVSFPKNGDLKIDSMTFDQTIGEEVLELVQTVAQSIQDGVFWPPKDLDRYIERVFGQMPQNIPVDELEYEAEIDDQEFF